MGSPAAPSPGTQLWDALAHGVWASRESRVHPPFGVPQPQAPVGAQAQDPQSNPTCFSSFKPSDLMPEFLHSPR